MCSEIESQNKQVHLSHQSQELGEEVRKKFFKMKKYYKHNIKDG